ncbi:hypothetical protein ACFYY2_27235 [Streptomyces sp. NPDC001822]|uniref:hypothetical protein n=1 Tax=Streptomyces sp. NPDC001822 TaxID=3364614 RepID=UPI00367B1076
MSGSGVTPGVVPEAAGGPPRTALELPATAAALRRSRRTVATCVIAGPVLLIVNLVFALLSAREALSLLWIPLTVSLAGGLLYTRARRMGRVLGSGPWVAHTSAVTHRGMHGATVVLARGPAHDELLVLTPHTTPWRFPLVSEPPVLWWCGDPRTGGVLAPPGGRELIHAVPVGVRRARRITGLPQVRNLAHRPGPRHPHLPPGTGHAPRFPAPADGGLTLAAFAAEAVSQAERRVRDPRAARPATRTRHAPWWRVRALRRTSGIERLTVRTAGAGALTALIGRPGFAVACVVLVLPLAAHTLRAGVPRARLLARLANAPLPEVKRYVLLEEPSGSGGSPVLLLFPADADDGAAPEAVVRLLRPGPRRSPWSGLPAPVGTAELRGRAADPSLAVPVVDGGPCWPADDYQELDLDAPWAVRTLEELLAVRA